MLHTLRKARRPIGLWTKGEGENDFFYFGTLGVQSCFIILTVRKAGGNNEFEFHEILTFEGIFWTAVYSKDDMIKIQEGIL